MFGMKFLIKLLDRNEKLSEKLPIFVNRILMIFIYRSHFPGLS